MANYQEYATYSETGETFKDKDCQVLSVSFEKEEGGNERLCTKGGKGTEGSNKSTAPLQQSAGCVGWGLNLRVLNVSLALLTNYTFDSKCKNMCLLQITS